ncbi:TIGR00288 family NYN domain-containing protein [Thermococcus nautili]|uniref:TIGR00288 family NYN domain-containing protein n=1 Tax=Thermococcus TaxID=2263 RepID=UPI00143135B0|nr:TIGR00288 family NYN domain-containing protein [Thermococcus nautili]NJE48431.1 TIGR00288 family NYN domain-containing protein [Thermococcus sp. 9N3]CAI1493611.1 NYN domain-containing protein [Thermococcus nautili]
MKETLIKVLKREKESPEEEISGKSIGLIIDGPNILRKEFGIKLEDIVEALERLGRIRVAKVVLNQYAPQGLIEAVVNQGLEPVIVAGDTDVRIAIEAMELIYNSDVDVIALATRDADFLPIIQEAKRKGKETIVIGTEPGFSVALQNAADYVIKMVSKVEE